MSYPLTAVFRGTRVPVHGIAAMLERSSTEAEILKAHPRITEAMIRLGMPSLPWERVGLAHPDSEATPLTPLKPQALPASCCPRQLLLARIEGHEVLEFQLDGACDMQCIQRSAADRGVCSRLRSPALFSVARRSTSVCL